MSSFELKIWQLLKCQIIQYNMTFFLTVILKLSPYTQFLLMKDGLEDMIFNVRTKSFAQTLIHMNIYLMM